MTARSSDPLRLLVIDKELSDLQKVNERLGEVPIHWSVSLVPNLADGVRFLLSSSCDALLLDAGRTEVTLRSGLETVEGRAKHVPIIAWTDSQELLSKASQCNSRQFLVGKNQLNWPLLDQFVRNARHLKRLESQLEGTQKLKRDVHAAHQVQEHLLPSRAPQLEGFDIAGRCYPAEDCSGDFFDFIPLPARRLAIVLADVSGHGFGPAILAAAIRSYLRMAAVLGNQVHEMLALANRLLLSDGELTPFASVFATSLDPESHTMRYASAGHPAYLIHFDGRTTRLESLAVPIGVRNDQMFTLSSRIKLRPGDVFLLASDGLFEAGAATGEQFGPDRAINVVRENAHEHSMVIVEKLHDAALHFTNNATLDDDQTIVVVRYAPRSGSLRETWTA